MRVRFFLAALCALPLSLEAQLIGLPPAPALSPEGFQIILEFETGGESNYNPRPEWPGFVSGVTVGVGYDCGYNSAPVIRADWKKLEAAPRLAATSGITGRAAKTKAAALRDVLVRWQLASEVFNEVTVARFYVLTKRTFPGLDRLHPNAQAALVSLVFNRGNSLVGERRSEMRAIRAAVARSDYREIARQLRAMVRLWRATDIERGMVRRRDAEAQLVEAALAGSS
jgi:GH24 family phage-related lysozyme (muramidase)